ncbi:MAG: hypothetical protein H6506_05010 [Calditrichaeota bacterium]|nr:hypothetical protein [Calditrichota bacterium]MCB9366375.1 hypothetical protein [Calditrichota bacterium]MCB9391995.1 hypothetical protein [Calditrichota bacterium]
MSLLIRQDLKHDGEFLMARDGADLLAAASGEWGPCLTLYEWDVPTLSVGFHQSTEKLDTERMKNSGVPLVRRPTGGAAVLHSEELTYSIVIPDAPDLRAGSLLLEYVGRSICEALNMIGVAAELDERGEALAPLANRTSCFVRTSRWEVAVRGKKIVGSAQRRQGSALLQHGSILLGDDHLRITDFLAVRSESERDMLRRRLEMKSTSVSREIGEADSRQCLRSGLAEMFGKHFSSFAKSLCAKSELNA